MQKYLPDIRFYDIVINSEKIAALVGIECISIIVIVDVIRDHNDVYQMLVLFFIFFRFRIV